MFNLCDTPKDESPIIDSKGIKQGSQNYGLLLELFDYDKTKKLEILEYETLRELVGKYLKMTLEVKRATDIPEKFQYKTKARYVWLDSEETPFETKVIERNKNPDFGYKQEHMIQITEELINHMMYNTLKIGIYGMIEAKRQPGKKRRENDEEDYYSETEGQGETRMPSSSKTEYDSSNRNVSASKSE